MALEKHGPNLGQEPVTEVPKLETVPGLNPYYTYEMGRAWQALGTTEDIDASNQYRQSRNLPLIELGDER